MSDDKNTDLKDMPPPSFREATSTQSYDRLASNISKSYIFLFYIFCAVIYFIDKPAIGWWWAAVLIGGMFVASILFAAPMTWLKIYLGTKGVISPFSAGGKILLLVMDFVGYACLWFVTRYVINALSA